MTTTGVEGKPTVESGGFMGGNTIRARHVRRDCRRSWVGETMGYTVMLGPARDRDIERMVNRADKLGANAVVGVRFMTS
ncbi:heavy metal-binding domain-containing protein [Candidatus Bipolaricaulota bacterium]|nr:heavy metal-binding domain-containing protein [Candidatus Bipolaricaulota bacterium]